MRLAPAKFENARAFARTTENGIEYPAWIRLFLVTRGRRGGLGGTFARARRISLCAGRFFRLTWFIMNEIRPDKSIERFRGYGLRKSEGTRSSLCSVNTAFSVLRTLIPTEPADRKLSKIETLRLASSYISHLDAMLVAGAIDQPCTRLLESSGAYPTRPQVCTFCLAMHKRYVSRQRLAHNFNDFPLVIYWRARMAY